MSGVRSRRNLSCSREEWSEPIEGSRYNGALVLRACEWPDTAGDEILQGTEFGLRIMAMLASQCRKAIIERLPAHMIH